MNKNLQEKLKEFIRQSKYGIATLRKHKLYKEQNKRSRELREERADGEEWLINELENLIKSK